MPPDQKTIFRDLRHYLAGRLVGITRDEAILHEVVKCLFARVWMPDAQREGLAARKSEPMRLAQDYRKAFGLVRRELPLLFASDEELLMDPSAIEVVEAAFAQLDFDNPHRDPLGDLYETFVGGLMRLSEGQFFTPLNAVDWLVSAVDPQPGEIVFDPACGAGGFLSLTARRWLASGADRKTIANSIFGVEKDRYLSDLAHAHIALALKEAPNIYCGDSIAWSNASGAPLPISHAGSVDVVLTNPPFGTKIISASDSVRAGFDLAHKWKISKIDGTISRTEKLATSTPPQVMFVERCLKLLKPGGRLGMVVPESLISSGSYAHVVNYLRAHAEILAVVGMPESLFKTSGKGGTHTKTCLVVARKKTTKEASQNRVFMAEAQWCGHDSRGRSIDKDDLPLILARYLKGKPTGKQSKLGYWVDAAELSGNVLAPRYHNPETAASLDRLQQSHDLVSVRQLVNDGLLTISSGDEVGKLAYGEGAVPFVRTSDLSNWEVKIDPKHCVSKEVYEKHRERQDVREGDILMVRDGTYLIGNCAYVSNYDTEIVYQSHLLKIRCTDHQILSPFLLLAMLSSEPVQRQIRDKRLTHDIIDTLGDRIYELLLPFPRDASLRKKVIEMVSSCIRDRIEARELARAAKKAVVASLDDALIDDRAANAISSKPSSNQRTSETRKTRAPRRGRTLELDLEH
ncbi:N-6 DNA methylase [Burkholderia vietnamiensis]|uniref:N-6 DNA methylase n=1 Tax=Burkholderia vietnamiensis TaxID=60552 RepID=UPI001594A8F3|nr:N-6 DNA methylase [Burkholderia vietnamiensis]